jgi:hypothetical protein
MRLFYVDDSGSTDTGYIVYSWIETTPYGWRTGLRNWLDLRKDLYAGYKIPPPFELHATKFVAGRQYPSTEPGFNRSKRSRREVMEKALATICASGDLRVGTVYRQTTAHGTAYHLQRQDLYAKLIAHLDTRLTAAGEFGMIFMDGNGSDTGYYNAHRDLKLASRSIIEDPLFQHSHRSQWVQMADLVAWTAYQGLLRHAGKAFAWNWYDKHLRGFDVNGGPLAL